MRGKSSGKLDQVLGCGVGCLGFGVWGLRFGVGGLEFGVYSERGAFLLREAHDLSERFRHPGARHHLRWGAGVLGSNQKPIRQPKPYSSLGCSNFQGENLSIQLRCFLITR